MKKVLVLIISLVVVSLVVGYIFKTINTKPVVITSTPDRKFVARDDSFKQVVNIKHDTVSSLKKKLSPYSRKETKIVPSVDSLVWDIKVFQNIVSEQDTLQTIQAKQITFIKNELYEKNNDFAKLQCRYTTDMDRQRKSKVKVFLSGLGVGAGTILIAVLIF